jgi:hypothetical protein
LGTITGLGMRLVPKPITRTSFGSRATTFPTIYGATTISPTAVSTSPRILSVSTIRILAVCA